MKSEQEVRDKIDELTEYTDHIAQLSKQYILVNPDVCAKYKKDVKRNRIRIETYKEILGEEQ